jgi:hypothetical protein
MPVGLSPKHGSPFELQTGRNIVHLNQLIQEYSKRRARFKMSKESLRGIRDGITLPIFSPLIVTPNNRFERDTA